ncbi:SDR family NAD(P)-dependent oxidoreductase [Lewinella sp. IMCC34183]|uniref:SDR family NAD(P)-dependent oxidoreductase n=1 Tax=Lewinella sp. IMCC34183 TaxID=2248762 RepID=UPI000E263A9D|nr:SDR family NAD(P)-dependent oxidoreductase [Lewinella sp. IMCC34183]
MSSIFITGSTDGLGQMAARTLILDGHYVYLHARNDRRAADARAALPGAAGVLVADLSDLEAVRQLARDANAVGPFATVMHNAAVYRTDGRTIADVNVLAPYLLTCLMEPPEQLIYLSSNDHTWGKWKAGELGAAAPDMTYADSKLLIATFALAVDRRWPAVRSNAIDPGWVPTKMGGKGAPDDLEQGYATQVWLAEGASAEARTSGRYLYHKGDGQLQDIARDPGKQNELINQCEQVTGVRFPEAG